MDIEDRILTMRWSPGSAAETIEEATSAEFVDANPADPDDEEHTALVAQVVALKVGDPEVWFPGFGGWACAVAVRGAK